VSERLLTARELGEAIGLKPATVLDKWERGDFPGYLFGRAVRFSLDEILALGRRGPGAGGGAPAPPDGNPTRGVVSVLPAPHNRGGDDA
jgi:predicted DNA-binding transcriptional regulator AlpA